MKWRWKVGMVLAVAGLAGFLVWAFLSDPNHGAPEDGSAQVMVRSPEEEAKTYEALQRSDPLVPRK